MNEAGAQILFLGSMSCLPIGITFLTLAIALKNRKIKRVFLFAGFIGLSQFIWYFQTLGIALGDKTGNATYPTWWVYILVGASIGVALSVLTIKTPEQIGRGNE